MISQRQQYVLELKFIKRRCFYAKMQHRTESHFLEDDTPSTTRKIRLNFVKFNIPNASANCHIRI